MSIFSCKACHKCSEKIRKNVISENLQKIVLVGNPNVGKSVIFNALSGFYVDVSNYPGTTVDISKAVTEFGEIIDTPGAYLLGNYTDDEIVTQNIVVNADIVINIVGALSIDRDLILTRQLIDMEFPLIVVVNQMDEARSRGIDIDCKKLEDLLGVKVVPAVAIQKQGIQEIISLLKNKEYLVAKNKTPFVQQRFDNVQLSRSERVWQILEIESKDSKNPEERETLYEERRKFVNEIIAQIISQTEQKKDISSFIGKLLLNPVIGLIVALGMLYLLFQILGVFVSGKIVDFLFSYLKDTYVPWIEGLVKKTIPFGYVNTLLVGEFGVLTMTVTIVLGILLPLITAFYLFMALLEDSGYLPRLAVLTDGILNKIGLNGRAVIPLILGFGCGAMGTMTTRILGSKKERTIVTAILGVTIPCAAQQGIIIALLATIGGFKVWMIYLLIIFIIMVLVGTVLNKILSGKSTGLIIDLPPMRLPQLLNTLKKTFYRVLNFLKEAIPLFALCSILITVLQSIGFLVWLQGALSPIVVNLLHLPPQFSDIFVMGLIRRDFASIGVLEMAGLENGTRMLTDLQILVASVVITLFVPCVAALIVIFKERGIKEALLLWLGTFVIAIAVGAIITRTLGFLF